MSGKDTNDKVVVDPALLEEAAASTPRVTVRADEPRAFARGTRDRVTVPSAPPPGSARGAGPRDLERDPVAVLRAWPHSTRSHDVPIANARPIEHARPIANSRTVPIENARTAPPQSLGQRRIQDKIVLAHFALDLFREIEDLQVIVERAHAVTEPGAAACEDPRCSAQANVLRGALVEACLLVQRVAMMAPDEQLDIEDRIHALLELLRR
ncbi:MAG: hypothetical protein ACRDMZ_25010 [Solirubrobacteraceae bacterium]